MTHFVFSHKEFQVHLHQILLEQVMEIKDILSTFDIEQTNNGASTGSSWLNTQGEIINVYSPVDGELMAPRQQENIRL